MNSDELSRFNSDNQAGNQGSLSPSSQTEKQTRDHITAGGRDGKALRKKLAISLGLRVGSSAGSSASTTSHSEEEPEPTDQNVDVLEMFRKQVKMTASKRRQIPKLNQQGVSNGESSMTMRRTVNRRTRTTTREFLDNTDDVDETDYQERSTDQTAKYLEHEKHAIIDNKRNDNTSQEQSIKTNPKITSQQHNAGKLTEKSQLINFTRSTDVTQEYDSANNLAPSDEIFSSFGEQKYSQTKINSGDKSVKLLREKIRTNARARKLSKPRGVGYSTPWMDGKSISSGKEVRDRASISVSKQTERRHSGSQIPVSIAMKKSEEDKYLSHELQFTKDDAEKNEIEIREMAGNKPTPKSKIPRRKSQNSADRQEIVKTIDSGIESLISEVFSSNDDFTSNEKEQLQKPTKILKIDIEDKGRLEGASGEGEVSVKFTQDLHSGINTDALFDGIRTTDVSMAAQIDAKHKNKTIIEQTKKNKLTDIHTNNRSLEFIRQSFSKQNRPKVPDSFNFDSLESELAILKASVFRTYDDFHEMNTLTLNLSKELKEMRHI